MTTDETANWLKAGITAARAGRRDEAQALLMQVVDVDERNEHAWLWLSGVVEGMADRRVCLENVLALNPDNELAQRGLAQLGPSEMETADQQPEAEYSGEVVVVRRERPAHSLASAVLYPERQVTEIRYSDPVPLTQAPAVTIAAESTYDDVWAREADLCAYCAHELVEADKDCPGCSRHVWTKEYRYPDPSVNIHILWVLLAGTGQMFLIQGLYHVIVEQVLVGATISGVIMVLFFVLAVGVYLRHSWAHLGAIVATAMVLLTMLIDALFLIDLSSLEKPLQGLDPAIISFLGPFVLTIGDFVQTLLLAAVALSLAYAIFGAAGDFQKRNVQRTAQLTRGLQFASDYHTTAKEFARKGLLGTAVLHWQRAVARESHHPIYLRYLGMTYAQLGFFERSLDVLQSGAQLTLDPDKQAEFHKLMAMVEQQQAANLPNAGRIRHEKL